MVLDVSTTWNATQDTLHLRITQVQNDDVIGREWAIRELAHHESDDLVTSFLAARSQSDSFWAVRRAAVEVLHSLNPDRPTDHPMALQADVNSKVRIAALRALASSENRDHLDLFQTGFAEDDSYLAPSRSSSTNGQALAGAGCDAQRGL